VEGGGSLTVLATVDAGTSALDALVIEELSPVSNAEIILARELAEARRVSADRSHPQRQLV